MKRQKTTRKLTRSQIGLCAVKTVDARPKLPCGMRGQNEKWLANTVVAAHWISRAATRLSQGCATP